MQYLGAATKTKNKLYLLPQQIIQHYSKSESCSVLLDSLWPPGLYSPWNSLGQNTGVGSLSFLQGIFQTQGSNPGLLHYRHYSKPSLCPNHWCQRSWSQILLWRPTRPSRTNTAKDVLFIIGDWNAKVGNQEIPGVTSKFGLGVKWSRAKANRVLPSEYTGQSKEPLPTTQETVLHMDTIRWSILKSHWLYFLQLKIEKLYTVSKNKTGRWL